MLFERNISFKYEVPLYAADGTFYLPDFTINWRGEDWYWEHVGRIDLEKYRNHWSTKQAWYEKFFSGRLLTTIEGPNLSKDAAAIIESFK
jgi:exodeoxyribonuclease V alpha subunit